jgi:hypothetical protein
MMTNTDNGCFLQLAGNGTRLDAYCSLRTGAVGILQASITDVSEMVFFLP